MGKRENSVSAILRSALRLYRAEGCSSVGVRRIASEAGVSLGMINHYFGSKEQLGASLLFLLGRHCSEAVSCRVRFSDDPVLSDLINVRVFTRFMLGRGYKAFYLDALREDLFFKYITGRPSVLIPALGRIYGFEPKEDDILLYSRFLPYMLEKTVVLKKEEGLFSSVSYDDLPTMICVSAMEHFIPRDEVLKRDCMSRMIASEVFDSLPELPSEDLVSAFAENLPA